MALKRSHSNTMVDNETEDMISCNVCLEEFNNEDRKPKFLPCSHSTCLSCLQAMIGRVNCSKTVQCPLCRKIIILPRGGIRDLPNNFYILHIIKLNKQILENHNHRSQGPHWCVNCGSTVAQPVVKASNLPINNSFSTSKSVFILQFYRGKFFLGKIHIQPSTSFNPLLMNEWGNVCFKNVRSSDSQVMKWQENAYVSMDMEHPYFTSRVPPFQSPVQARRAYDVGVAINTEQGEWVNGWEFVFLLKDLPPRPSITTAVHPHASLFGHIVEGYHVLDWIIFQRESQDQKDLVVTWESA